MMTMLDCTASSNADCSCAASAMLVLRVRVVAVVEALVLAVLAVRVSCVMLWLLRRMCVEEVVVRREREEAWLVSGPM